MSTFVTIRKLCLPLIKAPLYLHSSCILQCMYIFEGHYHITLRKILWGNLHAWEFHFMLRKILWGKPRAWEIPHVLKDVHSPPIQGERAEYVQSPLISREDLYPAVGHKKSWVWDYEWKLLDVVSSEELLLKVAISPPAEHVVCLTIPATWAFRQSRF